jgi:hypothetical protein
VKAAFCAHPLAVASSPDAEVPAGIALLALIMTSRNPG